MTDNADQMPDELNRKYLSRVPTPEMARAGQKVIDENNCYAANPGNYYTASAIFAAMFDVAASTPHQHPGAGMAVDLSNLDGIVDEAMQDAWDDICSDTGCHPLDIERRNGKLWFTPQHWASFTADHIRTKLSAAQGLLKTPAPEARLSIEAMEKFIKKPEVRAFFKTPDAGGDAERAEALEAMNDWLATNALTEHLIASARRKRFWRSVPIIRRALTTQPDVRGSVPISVKTLERWRQLVDLNPADLAPRIDALIEQARSGPREVKIRIKHEDAPDPRDEQLRLADELAETIDDHIKSKTLSKHGDAARCLRNYRASRQQGNADG